MTAAPYVDKIIKGANPANFYRWSSPRNSKVVLNMKTRNGMPGRRNRLPTSKLPHGDHCDRSRRRPHDHAQVSRQSRSSIAMQAPCAL